MGYRTTDKLPSDVTRPEEHFGRLLTLPEMSHIAESEIRIEWLMRTHPDIKAGRRTLGMVTQPVVTGRLRDLFTFLLDSLFQNPADDEARENPIDYLIILDDEWWIDASERDREALVFHELNHLQPAFDKDGNQRFSRETGLPVVALVGHDVEEFAAVVRRYGAWSDDVRGFLAAAAEGEANPAPPAGGDTAPPW